MRSTPTKAPLPDLTRRTAVAWPAPPSQDAEAPHDASLPYAATLLSPRARAVTRLGLGIDEPRDTDPSPAPPPSSEDDRYEHRARLGEGGMGEVHLVHDGSVGREVAFKVLRKEHKNRADLRARFLREGRIQGQLEHPAVVPVYDVGALADGTAFFTMKRVHGVTLADVLAALARGDEVMARKFSRYRLLSAFVSVCQAVGFAHTRGVVHRDLKPDNVMLGDFGEVYVLDWGLAKAEGSADEHGAPPEGPAAGRVHTAHGLVLGTPGYMAPEQARGDTELVSTASDVYALGAILFELLALVPLLEPGSPMEVLERTAAGVDVRAAARRARMDIPPELLDLCVQATALDPEGRRVSAGELGRAIERFLDGDRDLERRRELSRTHGEAARVAADEALAGAGSEAARRRALREVGRALALDPDNREALGTLVRLVTEPPAELPEEARREQAILARSWQREGSRIAALGCFAWVAVSSLGLFMGVRSWSMALVGEGLWLLAGALALWTFRHPHAEGKTPLSILAVSSLAVACSAWVFGPFMMAPALAAVNTLSFVVAGHPSRRWQAVAFGCGSLLLPVLFELAGIDARSFAFDGDSLVILPRLLDFPKAPTIVFLVVTNLALVVVSSLLVGRFKQRLLAIETRLFVQSWQLQQLVPSHTPLPVVARGPSPSERRRLR